MDIKILFGEVKTLFKFIFLVIIIKLKRVMDTYLYPTTLESEEYIYNPFTKNDLWAAPPQVKVPDQRILNTGADDGALPQLSMNAYGHSAPRTGSDTRTFDKNSHTVQRQEFNKNQYALLAFLAVLAVAVFPIR